jgi:hypothetical protein
VKVTQAYRFGFGPKPGTGTCESRTGKRAGRRVGFQHFKRRGCAPGCDAQAHDQARGRARDDRRGAGERRGDGLQPPSRKSAARRRPSPSPDCCAIRGASPTAITFASARLQAANRSAVCRVSPVAAPSWITMQYLGRSTPLARWLHTLASVREFSTPAESFSFPRGPWSSA